METYVLYKVLGAFKLNDKVVSKSKEKLIQYCQENYHETPVFVVINNDFEYEYREYEDKFIIRRFNISIV